MKRFLACTLLLMSLAACSGAASSPPRPNCDSQEILCIDVRAEEPIYWDQPVSIVITVTSRKDLPDLGVYFTTFPNTIIVQEASDVEAGPVTRKEQYWVNWQVDIKADQPVTFTRKINLPPEEGLFRIHAEAATPGISLRAADSLGIYMTKEGGKAYYSGTAIPITPGPLPTMDESMLATARAYPTDTPVPPVKVFETPTSEPELLDSTPPGYPPPGTAYP